MRSSDCDILIVPGLGNSGPDHWQTRWEQRLSTARRVEQDDWERPRPEDWVPRIVEAVSGSARPVVIVAHSLGVPAVVRAAEALGAARVSGAFLVSAPDVETPERVPPETLAFAPLPSDPLPFPSVLVASRDDPFCSFERAGDLANAWGSLLVDAGPSGHINAASGHGPWPEGLISFAGFLKRLEPRP